MNTAHPKAFGFLVHSRDIKDFLIKYPKLRFVPNRLLNFFVKQFPPIVVSKITGLKDKNENEIPGYLLGIPMTARQMMEDHTQALKKIKQALRLAKRKNISLIGLGALTASFSKGGKEIESLGVGITTGRAYTVKTVTDYAKKVLHLFSLPKEKVQVAIVGAAGSIGSACAKILALDGVKNFLFVDLERKAEHLKKHVEELANKHHDIKIAISHRVGDIKGYDIIIAATSAPEVVIISDDLSPGAVVINDAQPSDISPEIIAERPDVIVIEGGVVHTPTVRCNFNMSLADRNDTFCCLGEVLILAHNRHFDHYALGELDLSLIEHIEELAKNFPISLAPFQNNSGYVSEEQINALRKIIKKKYA